MLWEVPESAEWQREARTQCGRTDARSQKDLKPDPSPLPLGAGVFAVAAPQGPGMVVVRLPPEWACRAVLLLSGLASLTRGAHGEYKSLPG